MWVAYYRRMTLSGATYRTEIRATSRVVATAWYYFWALCYCINPFSTKQVNLYREVHGVAHLQGKKGMSSSLDKTEQTYTYVWDPHANNGNSGKIEGRRCDYCGKLRTGMGACDHCGSNIC